MTPRVSRAYHALPERQTPGRLRWRPGSCAPWRIRLMALIRAGNGVRPALEQEVCPGLHDPTREIKDDCAEGVARDKLAHSEAAVSVVERCVEVDHGNVATRFSHQVNLDVRAGK